MWASCSDQQERPLDSGYLNKATAFSGADWCVESLETAEMLLRDGNICKGQNHSAARGWEADCECEHPWFADISTKPHPFRTRIGASGPFESLPGKPHSASRVWEADFELGPPPLFSRITPLPSRIFLAFSATAESFLAQILVFRQPSYLRQMNWAETFPTLQYEKQILNFLERIWHTNHIFITVGNFWKSFVYCKQCWLSWMYNRTNQWQKILLSWNHKFESWRAAA